MTDFDGPLRMLLKKRRNGTYFALITPACDMTADTAMPTYTKRWRIENFHIPSYLVVTPNAGGLFAIIEAKPKSCHTRPICAFVYYVHCADHTPSVGSV